MIHFELSSGSDDMVAPYDWAAVASARTVTGQVNIMDSTSNYWQITGVQLEVGSQASPFEHRSYGNEYDNCLRYFLSAGNQNGFVMTKYGTVFRGRIYYPKRMRNTPTVTLIDQANSTISLYANSTNETQSGSDLETNNISENGFRLQFNNVALTADSGYVLYLEYTADAEL